VTRGQDIEAAIIFVFKLFSRLRTVVEEPVSGVKKFIFHYVDLWRISCKTSCREINKKLKIRSKSTTSYVNKSVRKVSIYIFAPKMGVINSSWIMDRSIIYEGLGV